MHRDESRQVGGSELAYSGEGQLWLGSGAVLVSMSSYAIANYGFMALICRHVYLLGRRSTFTISKLQGGGCGSCCREASTRV